MTEPMQETPCLTAKPPHKRAGFIISKENAAALAKKSLQARLIKAKEQAEYIANLEKEAEKAREIILAHALANKPVPAVEPEETYRLERLRITREQLEALDRSLIAAEDEKAVKAICDAIARLSEVERQLAGRPTPGSRRPEKAKLPKSTPAGPID